MIKQINVTRSSMPPFEKYVEEIWDFWENRRVSSRMYRTAKAMTAAMPSIRRRFARSWAGCRRQNSQTVSKRRLSGI